MSDSKEAGYAWYKRLMGQGTPMAAERAGTWAKRYPDFPARLAGELGLTNG